MTDLPIACTLTPDGMTARLALIDALTADALLDRTPTDAGLRVRLRATPEIERRTRELVADGGGATEWNECRSVSSHTMAGPSK